jgi:hypothetical protein
MTVQGISTQGINFKSNLPYQNKPHKISETAIKIENLNFFYSQQQVVNGERPFK